MASIFGEAAKLKGLKISIDADAVPAVTAQLRTLMVEAASLKVALVVDVGVGQNWDEAH